MESLQLEHEKRDRLKSGVITAAIMLAVLLFVYWYRVVQVFPPQQEVVTQMLINFGDNRNGSGEEEPLEQEGSLAAVASPDDVPSQPLAESQPVQEKTAAAVEDKVLTGTNNTAAVKSADKTTKKVVDKKPATKTAGQNSKKTAKPTATNANSNTGKGDGKGTAAVGNLLKGRGTKGTGQGDGSGPGNAGDPLGGEGNGDSKIGIDRKLLSYIPGTMGRGGSQPSHNCSASGKISIAYTVDKAGNVVSAHRSGGISDPCAVSTTVGWVKRYVKAERSTVSSTGTYSITF